MSKTISYSDTASSHPVSYDSDYSAYSVSGLNQGETDSSSTNYATINFTRGNAAETIIFYNFDFNIPTAATITSVTCEAKCYISTTNSSRIATRLIQLYSGSTAMGSAYTVSNSTSEFTMNPGTWTAAQLNNAKVRLYAKRGSSNTTTNYYYRFYGCTITVEYTVNSIAYEVTTSSNVSGVTIQPATQDVLPGDSAEVVVSSVSDVIITDNGVDVTANFVTASDTLSAVAESQTHSGLDGGTSYANYAVGYSAENPNSQNGNMYAESGSTGYVDYVFDFSDIPSGATINSVEVKVYGKRENSTTDSSHMAKIGLYSGSTLKSTEQLFTSTSMQTITITNPGTWTRVELQSAKLRFTVAYYGGAISGITWTVNYIIDGYQYTISNVQADHVIVVQSLDTGNIIYIKVNGTWKEASNVLVKSNGSWISFENVYKKVNGSWVQQDDASAVFDSSKLYVSTNTLPSGYTKLRYLESSNAQLIDTNYIVQETDTIEVDYELTSEGLSQSGDKFIIGAVGKAGGGYIWVETYGPNNTWYYRFGHTASSNRTYGSFASGTFAIKKLHFSVGSTDNSIAYTSMPPISLTLFGRINASDTFKGAWVRISEARIKNGTELVHRYVPVKRNSDNELGMLDLIDNVFYTNVGTGTFGYA